MVCPSSTYEQKIVNNFHTLIDLKIYNIIKLDLLKMSGLMSCSGPSLHCENHYENNSDALVMVRDC